MIFPKQSKAPLAKPTASASPTNNPRSSMHRISTAGTSLDVLNCTVYGILGFINDKGARVCLESQPQAEYIYEQPPGPEELSDLDLAYLNCLKNRQAAQRNLTFAADVGPLSALSLQLQLKRFVFAPVLWRIRSHPQL